MREGRDVGGTNTCRQKSKNLMVNANKNPVNTCNMEHDCLNIARRTSQITLLVKVTKQLFARISREKASREKNKKI